MNSGRSVPGLVGVEVSAVKKHHTRKSAIRARGDHGDLRPAAESHQHDALGVHVSLAHEIVQRASGVEPARPWG
jgi:hypothetical protein